MPVFSHCPGEPVSSSDAVSDHLPEMKVISAHRKVRQEILWLMENVPFKLFVDHFFAVDG